MSDPSRRQFLGAAAALSTLPVVGSSKARADRIKQIRSDEHGNTRTDIQSGEPIHGIAEMGEQIDQGASISLSGYSYDSDEDSVVECRVNIGGLQVFLSVPPERAHELSKEFELAAHAAENGGEA